MRIGVLTSGGDAPGMNAALRTLGVAGTGRGHEVLGIVRGYDGLLDAEAITLDPKTVEGATRLGGTILGSARCLAFPTPDGQARAAASIAKLGLDALVVIGGNGSLAGAHALATGAASGLRVIGIPASIDNDVGHCGLAIGCDTAVNTIVQACDRISDTARAHHRAFIVEVMGRKCGFLAMRAGIAAEADAILYGEKELSEEQVVEQLRGVLRRCFAPGGHKRRCLIIKSEGVGIPIHRLVERLEPTLAIDAPGVDLRETVLGHVVRGGDPSALDRTIAQRLAFGSIVLCERGATDVMLSWEVPGSFGQETPDPSVRIVPLPEVLAETARLLDGTSPILRRRLELLSQVEDLFTL